MLNNLKNAALISLVSLLLHSYTYAQNENQIAENLTIESEASSIVLNYLDALSQGDTIAIKELLGGQYLENRSTQLDNPNYTNTLSKIYSNANSEILDTEIIDDINIAVDTKIALSPDEILWRRFIVTKDDDEKLKIIDEREHSKQ